MTEDERSALLDAIGDLEQAAARLRVLAGSRPHRSTPHPTVGIRQFGAVVGDVSPGNGQVTP